MCQAHLSLGNNIEFMRFYSKMPVPINHPLV